MCISNFLYEVQQLNRLRQNGLLKRFSLECEGTQPTLEYIRSEKNKKFYQLNSKSRDYEKWFLKYIPSINNRKQIQKNKQTRKNKKTRRNTIKSKKNKTEKQSTIQNVFDLYRNI